MNSRMDKYQQDDGGSIAVKERTKKNRHLYDELQNMNIDYINIDVNDAKIITSDNMNKRTRADYQKIRELERILPQEKKEIQKVERPKKEQRVYDINEILRLARNNKLFEEDNKKRLINTEYNILTKLDIDTINEHEDMTKEGLKKLIDKIYQNEDTEKEKNSITNEDTALEEDDLLSDLMIKENEVCDKEKIIIDEAISKKILEHSSENEGEKFDTTEENEIVKKIEKQEESISDEELLIEESKSKKILVVVIIIVFLLLASGIYLFLKYFSTL